MKLLKIYLILFVLTVLPVLSYSKKQDQLNISNNDKEKKDTIVKFVHTIVFVKDIEVSKKFYSDILGLKVIKEYDTLIVYENGLAIHKAKPLYKTIYKKELERPIKMQGMDNIDIYFECNDLEAMYDKLVKNNVKFIHLIEMQFWGQSVMRFYDPDGHIVEIGKPLHIKFDN